MTENGSKSDQIEKDFKLIKIRSDGKKKISKVNVITVVFLWLITAWGIIAEKLTDDENIYLSDSTKFWIGITIPVSTSLVAVIKSIQVGMEIKSIHVNNNNENYRAEPKTIIVNNYNDDVENSINRCLTCTPRMSINNFSKDETSSIKSSIVEVSNQRPKIIRETFIRNSAIRRGEVSGAINESKLRDVQNSSMVDEYSVVYSTREYL